MNKSIHLLNETAQFLWRRAMRQSELLGVALGCGLSFSLYALAQLWPVFPAFLMGLLVGPLVTALVAQRRVVLWGAVTNSLLMAFCWFAPLFLLRASLGHFLVGFSGVVSRNWFPYLAALCGVQAISLFTTLPVMWFRFSRSGFKSSGS